MLPADLVAKLADCARANFIHERDKWLSWQSVSAWAVILGLALEGPEFWYDMLDFARTRIERFKYRIVVLERNVESAKAIAIIGWVFIIGGLLGELRASSKITDLSASIQSCSDAKVQGATLEAGDAATSAQRAHEELNEVERKSAAINNRLDEASTQLGVIEERNRALGPRWLILANGGAKLIRNLKAFSGSRITVLSCGPGISPIEQLGTEQRLLTLLGKPGTNWTAANWETGYERWTECSNTSSNGLEMAISGNASESLEKAADALRDQLLGLGIATSLQTVPAEQEQFWAAPPWGADCLEARAARDPNTIFLLVAPNAMVEAAKPSKRTTKRLQ